MTKSPEVRGSPSPAPVADPGALGRYVGSQAIMVARHREAFMSGDRREVVASLDDSGDGYLPVARAADEAALRGWSLRIVHVQTPAFGPHPRGMVRMTGAQLLNDVATRVREARPIDVSTYLGTGTAAGNLVEASTRAGLVVIGVRGRNGLGTLWAGSVAIHVAEYAHCPVMLVRLPDAGAQLTWTDHSVVVGVDGSPGSYAALTFAAAEAALHDGSVLAVHAVDGDDSRSDPLTQGPLAEARTEYRGVPLQRREVVDDPRNALLRLSATASALVVGARGTGGYRGLHTGVVEQAMVRRARSPLFVVHER